MSEPDSRARDENRQEYKRQVAVSLAEIAANNRRISELSDKSSYRPFEKSARTDRLFELIAAGVPSRKAAEDCDINPVMIHKWATRDREFYARYIEARVCQAWSISEELLSIADDCPADVAEVAKARIRIDTRKWLLSKVIPRIFGDKLEVTQDIKGSPQVNIILPGKGGSSPGLPPAPPDATATITLSQNSSDPIDVTPKPSE